MRGSLQQYSIVEALIKIGDFLTNFNKTKMSLLFLLFVMSLLPLIYSGCAEDKSSIVAIPENYINTALPNKFVGNNSGVDAKYDNSPADENITLIANNSDDAAGSENFQKNITSEDVRKESFNNLSEYTPNTEIQSQDIDLQVINGEKINQTNISDEPSISTEITPSDRGYISEEDFYRNRPRSHEVCFPSSYCFNATPRKGNDSINYFKSLNFTDEYIYIIIQFEGLSGMPTEEQKRILADDNITLISNLSFANGRNYDAKAPIYILESKSYDFVYWTGVNDVPISKVFESLHSYITNESCAGLIKVRLLFYEYLSEHSFRKIAEQSQEIIESSGNSAIIRTNLDNIYPVASLNFVKKIDVVPTAILNCFPSPSNQNCGVENTFQNISCIS